MANHTAVLLITKDKSEREGKTAVTKTSIFLSEMSELV